MKKLILIFLIVITSLVAKMEFTEPEPSFDNPRQWVIKLNTNDLSIVNHTLDAINNVMKIYPSQTLNITVIAYAKGMNVLRKNYDKNTLIRIKSVMEYDVEFIGCRNTMETMNWKEDEFIDNISYVQAGIAQVIEKVAAGWIDVTPY